MSQRRSSELIDFDNQISPPQQENEAFMLNLDKQPSQIEVPVDIIQFECRQQSLYSIGQKPQQQHEPNHHQNQKQNQYKQVEPQNKPEQLTIIKKCICKKTMCLKMYCECFNSNIPCNSLCLCINCKNTSQHHQEIQEAKYMIRQKGIVGLHNCNVSEKRCNCMKSKCRKKYCECFNSGVLCTQACKCVGCLNCPQEQKMIIMESAQGDQGKVQAKASKSKRQKKVTPNKGKKINKDNKNQKGSATYSEIDKNFKG